MSTKISCLSLTIEYGNLTCSENFYNDFFSCVLREPHFKERVIDKKMTMQNYETILFRYALRVLMLINVFLK